MMQPGSPQALMPPDESTLMRRVQDLERQVRELVAHDVLRAAGVETAADLFKILGTLQVTGDMLSEGELRVTGDILAEGELRVTGDTVIEGNLSVPNGKIKNDWLESPLNPKSAYGNEDSFALTTTPTARGAWTITVPDGYTNAFVVVNAYLQAINNSGSTQYIFVRAYAVDTDGTPHWGTRTRDTLAHGFVGTPQAYLARELDGLTPGEDLTFYAEVNASAAIAADALNFAGGEALVIFTR